MYEEFYNFKEAPFNVTPDPRFLYRSESHRDALAYITYGIFQKKGFIAVTGEVGVGKTTVVNAFLDLFQSSLDVSFIFSTKFPFEQLLYLVCSDFGLNVENMNKAQMLLTLNRFLISQYEKDRNTVLIVDEAQNLSVDVLEEFRMLSNLETRDRKLLQIMLVGQPELENILNLDRMRQLRQRIPGICKIPMLNREETNNYINFRIHVVSEGKDAPVFYENAVDEIYYYSGGIPRLINVLCDRVLLHGYVGNTRRIDVNLVREAMRDLKDQEKIPVDRLKR